MTKKHATLSVRERWLLQLYMAKYCIEYDPDQSVNWEECRFRWKDGESPLTVLQHFQQRGWTWLNINHVRNYAVKTFGKYPGYASHASGGPYSKLARELEQVKAEKAEIETLLAQVSEKLKQQSET